MADVFLSGSQVSQLDGTMDRASIIYLLQTLVRLVEEKRLQIVRTQTLISGSPASTVEAYWTRPHLAQPSDRRAREKKPLLNLSGSKRWASHFLLPEAFTSR